MQKILTLFLIFIFFNSFSQDKQYFDKTWKPCTKENAAYYRTILKKGQYYDINDYYINGQLQFSGVSKTNSEPFYYEGEAKWYFDNGRLKDVMNFQDNLLNGKKTSYYSNGNKLMEGNYKNDKPSGNCTNYFPSGKIQASSNFVDGQVEGKLVKYYAENMKEEEFEIKNGRINGPYEMYNVNGKLSYKGNTKNGQQEGKCYMYYYDGPLFAQFEIQNGLLTGDYLRLSIEGDTLAVGVFEKGKAISFQAKSIGSFAKQDSRFQLFNFNPITQDTILTFSSKMKLRNGIENWKIFRNNQLIIEGYYKEGKKYGIWNVYTFDGSRLYQTMDYSVGKCEDTYLQKAKNPFEPSFALSDRFSLDDEFIIDKHCAGSDIKKKPEMGENDHPFYHTEPIAKVTETPKKKERNDDFSLMGKFPRDVEYKEPANSKAFKGKNNVLEDFNPAYPGVSYCEKRIGELIYKFYASENKDYLLNLKLELIPKDNEILFFYQKMEERTYLKGEKLLDRYMSFSLPSVVKEALELDIMNDIIVSAVIEHEFFSVSDFSGTAASSALEKEFKQKE